MSIHLDPNHNLFSTITFSQSSCPAPRGGPPPLLLPRYCSLRITAAFARPCRFAPQAAGKETPALELRATRDLARLWSDLGERRQTCDLLAPVYSRFTEGFATPDLIETKAVLDSLA